MLGVRGKRGERSKKEKWEEEMRREYTKEKGRGQK